MQPGPSSVSAAELLVLKCLWQEGSGTPRELLERMQRSGSAWAYTTLATLLARLLRKGCVRRRAQGDAHVYTACITREALLGHGLAQLVERVADGSAAPLLASLVEGQKLDAGELAHLRQRIEALERKARATRGGPP